MKNRVSFGVAISSVATIALCGFGLAPAAATPVAEGETPSQASCGVSIKSQTVKNNRRYATVHNTCGSSKLVKFDIKSFPDPGSFRVKANGDTSVNYISAGFPKARGVYIK